MTKSTPAEREALKKRVRDKWDAFVQEKPEMFTAILGSWLKEGGNRVSPELQKAVGSELIERAFNGDVTVWAELMVDKPELFRDPMLAGAEDLAWQELLTNGTPAQRGEPSSAPSSATQTS